MIGEQEKLRAEMQFRLDSEKSIEDRRRLGQFSTPTELAREIVDYALKQSSGAVRFMDPAFGTGAFYSSLVAAAEGRLDSAVGFEIDSHYFAPTSLLWKESKLKLTNSDFLAEKPNEKCNLLVCNPPYTRHHLIPQSYKQMLHDLILEETSISLSGLSGMYCYYMLACHKWLAPGALSAWLIPSEFMDVGYGKEIKDYLLHRVNLLRIHRYDPEDVQFDDALVSSAIVLFRNEPPGSDSGIVFSYGGSLEHPGITREVSRASLEKEPKWTRFPLKGERRQQEPVPLSRYFRAKRGIATGSNRFFIMRKETAREIGIPESYLKPILPSPREMRENVILAGSDGYPTNVTPLALLNCKDDEQTVLEQSQETYDYLKKGEGDVSAGYLCRKRKLWYLQEQREAAPIICSYMGRGEGTAFRFILNKSEAIVTNSYIMLYPTELFREQYGTAEESIGKAWAYLNQNSFKLSDEGRVYGGGLQKIEPKELMNVDASDFDEYMRSAV